MQGLGIALATALAYAAVGAAALAVAGAPGYAAPLYPSAGIALAAALVYGRVALLGALLGALVVNSGLAVARGQSGLDVLQMSLIIAFGAALQAGVGAALVRRFVSQPLVLNAPRDIALAGLMGALVACVVSPSIATLTLVAVGVVPASGAMANWLVWWSGDTLGVLIATPLALTFIGQPAADWRPRRRTLALPLLLALALSSAALIEAERLHRDRQQAIFDRDAHRLAAEAAFRLSGALHALQALHGVAQVHGGLDRKALSEASRWWLAQPIHLQATGYGERVPADRVAAFEAAVRAEGRPGYRVFDRDGGADRQRSGEVLAVRHIEPEADNAGAVGVNSMSVPAAREAIAATRLSGTPVASEAFRLTQSTVDEAGVVLYQALYEGQPDSDAARMAQFKGAVFVTLRTERALADLLPRSQAFMRWCVYEQRAGTDRSRWGGERGCESRATPVGHLSQQRIIEWGGRTLIFAVHADPQALPGEQREAAWLLALLAMAAAAMLGALLLTVTGHSRRTQIAVNAGTEQLRGQVAERLQAEAALRESSERLRSILDNVPLGVMFLDPQGQLIECNRRFCDMTGRGLPQLLGHSIASLVHENDAPTIRRLRRDLIQGSGHGLIESIRLRGAGGHEVVARVSVSAMRGPGGDLLRMVGVVEDITEHLRLEASERALHRAEAANRAKSDFLSRMSHELRTPLNAMIGFAQLLGLDRAAALAPHQREWTQQIQRAGWHLLEMINETLDLARIEAGAVPLTLAPLEVAPMVAACRAMLAGPAAQRGVTITEALSDDAVAMLGDATRVKQVLTNLLSNAVKYNREGGTVHVGSRLDGTGRLEISVTDTGLGMSAVQMASLFQPYNRLGRENSPIEGTGIGLVIARRLSELMGGSLSATSREGVGTTFTLALAAAEQADRPQPNYTQTSPAPYHQRHVHYVEDNETNIEVMRGVLAQRTQVVLGTSMLGLDGLSAIRRDRPDLILLDMHLPDISGLELLRHLKQDDDVAEIPVIVVSADATPGHMEQALTLGALHYVTKPLDVAAFLPLLDDALQAADTRWGM